MAMKISPWLALMFGIFVYPVLAMVFSDLLVSHGIYSAYGDSFSFVPLDVGIVGAGLPLGCATGLALLLRTKGHINWARVVASGAGVGEIVLLLWLCRLDTLNLDLLTGLCLIWPLCWCLALLVLAVRV